MLKPGTIEVNGGQCATEIAGVMFANPAQAVAAAGPIPDAATRNACKLCAPLGACVVFSGLAGCVPFLHGSQGCATYIRRYLISHFREPVDIGSSSFSEEETVFGGARNLQAGLANIARQYHPASIGVATTCLAETIGEDVPRILEAFTRSAEATAPPLIHVSTPSYAGTHMDGFHAAVLSVVQRFAKVAPQHGGINLLPGFVSPEDLRHLKELMEALGLSATLLPDYSDTLDGQTWSEYQRIQAGGTTLEAITQMPGARATFEFGRALATKPRTAASWLEKQFNVPRVRLGLPIGLRETDGFFGELERVSGKRFPDPFYVERGRLIDAMVDGHKYLFGKRAALYGDADLVVGLASFLDEIGIQPVLCATGARLRSADIPVRSNVELGQDDGNPISPLEDEHCRGQECPRSQPGGFETLLREVVTDADTSGWVVLEGADHAQIAERARRLKPDLLLGSSKGYPVARELGVPLVRVGFPIHDRIGGQRVLHLGYRGAQRLLDQIVNTLLERRQDDSGVGYSYL
jgi:nitrogenase molybdenum-iron protein NifN